ncbi:MAG: helix-turn-helix domain-containing protein [Lachnospiraceae bacterium]|nr:helix-turn-helix domain-containing protein [Lachnospiraceae bacterium]MCM1230387.1 helix-turn-helix domain-containing protein [Ruminococcus flavefaciens]
MENEIMKFEEVMEFLDIGKNMLYKLLKSGEIQAFRIGKVWKIPRKSVEEYVNNKVRSNLPKN